MNKYINGSTPIKELMHADKDLKDQCDWDPSKHGGEPCPHHDHGEKPTDKFNNLTDKEKKYMELASYENDFRKSIRKDAANEYIKSLDKRAKRADISEEEKKKILDEKKAVEDYFLKGGDEEDYVEFFEEIVDNSDRWDDYFNDPKIKEYNEFQKDNPKINYLSLSKKLKPEYKKARNAPLSKKDKAKTIVALGASSLVMALALYGAVKLK